MLQRAFAAYGPSYAKSIVELANKIAAMPQESRDGYVAALDLTSEDMEEEGELPIGSEVQADGADYHDEDDDTEFVDDTVHATLATAGTRTKPVVASGKYSVGASAVLNGDAMLFM